MSNIGASFLDKSYKEILDNLNTKNLKSFIKKLKSLPLPESVKTQPFDKTNEYQAQKQILEFEFINLLKNTISILKAKLNNENSKEIIQIDYNSIFPIFNDVLNYIHQTKFKNYDDKTKEKINSSIHELIKDFYLIKHIADNQVFNYSYKYLQENLKSF